MLVVDWADLLVGGPSLADLDADKIGRPLLKAVDVLLLESLRTCT